MLSKKIKICERCFLCPSIVFCLTYNQCPNCCSRSTRRGKTAKLLANLGNSGCRSESGKNTERRLDAPLSDLAELDKVTNHHKLLCQSPQETLPVLHQLINKNTVELVKNQTSLGVFKLLFSVSKPNNRWRSILDLSNLNQFLKGEKFKMKTPETIMTSLQQGELVTSIGFKDAYFHIPIHEQSRKYIRFHIHGWSSEFKALPFGLSAAPMEVTVIAKEVKLMALHKGMHHYLDDWFVRARSIKFVSSILKN